jgi:GxxExxY protein
MELIYKEEAYKIIGACFEVYNVIGCGFPEAVYQECLELEFGLRELSAVPQLHLKLHYKEKQLKQWFEPDFICFDKVILEIKALSELVDEHRAQVHNYLKATGYKLGLLVNFGSHPNLKYERIVY